MLRISKLADYSAIVMAYLANSKQKLHSAKTVAEKTQLALPTVSKLLKLLTRAKLLISQQGINGGYSLAKSANKISLAEIISAVEGEIALTSCSEKDGDCALQSCCSIQHNLQLINKKIYKTLADISLAELCVPFEREEHTIATHFSLEK